MRAALVAAVACLALACGPEPVGAPRKDAGARADAGVDLTERLDFVRDKKAVRGLLLGEILAAIPAETWTAYDPYYNRDKRWRAVPLARVVELGFGEPAATLAGSEFLLRARDGYTVPMPAKKVLEKGGYIAFADDEVPAWEPIGPRRANPGPYYVVWRDKEQWNLEDHPRPWQLATIEIARFEDTFPDVVPHAAAEGSPALRGLAIFREQCILCHAVNRQGGRVGPDLNVPQSIVEYRPEAQIRAYIKDPLTFRYGTMPAHPNLTDADLDALIAYFTAMKGEKKDRDAAPAKADDKGQDGGAP